MPDPTYSAPVNDSPKPLVWLRGEVKTPPFSKEARIESGTLLRLLQMGQSLSMPHSRPMPMIGRRCHELRVTDENVIWRIFYRTDKDAIVIAEVYGKKSQKTPQSVLDRCKKRLVEYDTITGGK